MRRYTDDYDLYSGPLANGDQVLLLVDHSNARRTRTLDFAAAGISSANVKDLWLGELATNANFYTTDVDAYGPLL